MITIMFYSTSDANLVAQHLYNCHVENNILKVPEQEQLAVDLAIGLAGVEIPITEGASCLLAFPGYERECQNENAPQIYVVCLSSYNSGLSHGMWIDCTQDAEKIEADIRWMLSWSPCRQYSACEDWAIHAYENWQGVHINEYEDIENLSELSQALLKHGEAYAAYYQYDSTSAYLEKFEEIYCGVYDSEEDFVYEELEQNGALEQLEKLGISSSYINLTAIATDWFISSFYSIEKIIKFMFFAVYNYLFLNRFIYR
ncbi:antirestriction protein ArdA [Anabaena azotica]|nr:antirestriction protein ArdA [Anabaena azotica]